MKNVILFYLLCFVSTFDTFGQVSYGVKAGVNQSYLNVEREDGLFSWHAGVYSNIPLSDNWFFQPELVYSKLGTKLPDYFVGTSLNLLSNYISMPLMVGLKAGNHFSFTAGPQISYLVDSTIKAGQAEYQGDDGFFTMDIGLQAGASYFFKDKVGLYFRYTHGLRDVLEIAFTDANGQSLGGLDYGKARVFQLGLCFNVRA